MRFIVSTHADAALPCLHLPRAELDQVVTTTDLETFKIKPSLESFDRLWQQLQALHPLRPELSGASCLLGQSGIALGNGLLHAALVACQPGDPEKSKQLMLLLSGSCCFEAATCHQLQDILSVCYRFGWLQSLALAMSIHGALPDALALQRFAVIIPLLDTSLGADSAPAVQRELRRLAGLYAAQGDYDYAEQLLPHVWHRQDYRRDLLTVDVLNQFTDGMRELMRRLGHCRSEYREKFHLVSQCVETWQTIQADMNTLYQQMSRWDVLSALTPGRTGPDADTMVKAVETWSSRMQENFFAQRNNIRSMHDVRRAQGAMAALQKLQGGQNLLDAMIVAQRLYRQLSCMQQELVLQVAEFGEELLALRDELDEAPEKILLQYIDRICEQALDVEGEEWWEEKIAGLLDTETPLPRATLALQKSEMAVKLTELRALVLLCSDYTGVLSGLQLQAGAVPKLNQELGVYQRRFLDFLKKVSVLYAVADKIYLENFNNDPEREEALMLAFEDYAATPLTQQSERFYKQGVYLESAGRKRLALRAYEASLSAYQERTAGLSAIIYEDVVRRVFSLNTRLGRTVQNLSLIEQALALQPGLAEFHFLHAKAYEHLSRWQDALSAYTRTLELLSKPGGVALAYWEPFFARLKLHDALMCAAQVQGDIIFLRRAAPEFPYADFYAAKLCEQQGNYLGAFHAYLLAFNKSLTCFNALKLSGRGAIDQLRVQLRPFKPAAMRIVTRKSRQALVRLGRVLINQGRLDGNEVEALIRVLPTTQRSAEATAQTALELRRAYHVQREDKMAVWRLYKSFYESNEASFAVCLDYAQAHWELAKHYVKVDRDLDDAQLMFEQTAFFYKKLLVDLAQLGEDIPLHSLADIPAYLLAFSAEYNDCYEAASSPPVLTYLLNRLLALYEESAHCFVVSRSNQAAWTKYRRKLLQWHHVGSNVQAALQDLKQKNASEAALQLTHALLLATPTDGAALYDAMMMELAAGRFQEAEAWWQRYGTQAVRSELFAKLCMVSPKQLADMNCTPKLYWAFCSACMGAAPSLEELYGLFRLAVDLRLASEAGFVVQRYLQQDPEAVFILEEYRLRMKPL